jgi:hypothetical protein
MNRTSDREARLVALGGQIRVIREAQEVLATRVDRIDDLQIRMASILLKLNRELGAQREKYPLE